MSTYAEKLEELQRLRAEVRSLERATEVEAKRMQPLTEHDEREMVGMQARADSAYVTAGRKAPPPLAHERPDEYRRRLVAGVQGYSERWRKGDVSRMRDDVLEIAEGQIFADAIANGRSAGLRPTEMQMRAGEMPGGHKTVEFVGGPEASFVRYFERPSPRVTFKTNSEYNQMAHADALARVTEVIRYRPIPQPMRTGF